MCQLKHSLRFNHGTSAYAGCGVLRTKVGPQHSEFSLVRWLLGFFETGLWTVTTCLRQHRKGLAR